MTTMQAELYDALIAAGAPEDKARAGAVAVAAYDGRFAKIETDLSLLKWMISFNLAATVGILMLLLKH